MKNLNFKQLLAIKDSERICDMASIGKTKTGLDIEVWVENNGVERKTKHNLPRMKFVDLNTKNRIPISISKEPKLLGGYTLNKVNIDAKQFNTLKEWIVNNYDGLIDLWNGDITSDVFIDNIIKA